MPNNVPAHFLESDETTTVVDFAPFADAEEIGDKCLYKATAVTEIRNLHLLSKVRRIGASFVFGNHMSHVSPIPIKTIDLSAFTLVTELQRDFILYTCIVHIDLTALRNVVKVGDALLYSNKLLESVDFSSWTKCEAIGHYFLACCKALRFVDLAGFAVSLKKIGQLFLGGSGSFVCPLLSTSVTESAHLDQLKKHLDQVDLAPLLNVPEANIEDADLKKTLKRVRNGGSNDLQFAPKRRAVNLVMYKSKSRLGAMLASHFVPRRLVLLFVAPPEYFAPKSTKQASAT